MVDDRRRTAVVRAAGQGSGHVLSPRLVLTARHVLGDRTDATVQTPGGEPTPCRVVWSRSDGPYDTALLLAERDLARDPAPVRWGRLVTPEPTQTSVRGYTGLSGRDGRLGSTSFRGTLDPMEAVESDRYVLGLTGSPPLGSPTVSPWAGLSGGAVWCAGTLVGVAVADLPGWPHSRIEAVPSYVLFADEAFRELVRRHTGSAVHLEPAEFADHAEPIEPLVPRSAATLLHPRAETVRFTGRRELLDEMVAWSTSGDDVSVALLAGAGGAGKTRLAREAGHQLAASGYAVVHLRRGSAPEQHRLLAGTTAPVLLVVDYAESRVEELGDLLRHLGRRPRGAPFKVLLVARAVGPWWEEVRSHAGAEAADMSGQARRWSILDTSSLGVDEDEVFRTAVEDLARGAAAIGLAVSPPTPGGGGPSSSSSSWPGVPNSWPGVPNPGRRTVLDIHMAALASVLAPSARTQVRGAQEALLGHELAYWKETSRRAPLSTLGDAALRNAVVTATLVGPVARSRAHTMLAHVPRIGDHRESVRRAVADWLHELYPRPDSAEGGGAWQWGPLQPDPLGEYLVGTRVAAEPEIFLRLLHVLDAEETVGSLVVLSRAAARVGTEPLTEVLRTAVRASPERLASLLVAAGTRSAEPAILIAALDQILVEELLPPDQLLDLAQRIPALTRALASWSIRLHEKLVQVIDEQSSASPALQRASSLHNLAMRLMSAHRYEESLDASTAALGILDEEGTTDPLLRGLALHQRAAALGKLGRVAEAVREGRESVDLVTAWRPKSEADRRFVLAAALNNLSHHLADAGEHDEGLAVARTSVGLRRELAEQYPGTLPDLARSLNTLTLRLHDVGLLDEALEAAEESLVARRTAADDQPDAYLAELASTLTNKSNVLLSLDDVTGALEARAEVVAIERHLVRSGTESAQADLVLTLHSAVELSVQVGAATEALHLADEAVGLARRLVVAHGHAYLPLLGGSFLIQTLALTHASCMAVAFRVNNKAAQIFRTVHRADPTDYRGLLTALTNQLQFLRPSRRHEEAEQVAAEAVAVLTELTDPTGLSEDLDSELAEECAAAHVRHAGALIALGRQEHARQAYDSALDLYRALDRAAPGSFADDIAETERLRDAEA
ncbi:MULTISPECIES: trypsin-like peptidase domain-containing protein [unclassified Streptomyces]|uniref:P-loop NTPase n=1 Tax=unclassified Streptomyces TaxID=2593676 RepID=UPI0033D0D282